MKTELFGYQLGFYIEEPDKSRDYELTKNVKTWLSCPNEDMVLWEERVKDIISTITAQLLSIQYDYVAIHELELKTLDLNAHFINIYCKVHNGVKMFMPHLVMYYLQYDKSSVIDLLSNLKTTYELVSKGKESLMYSADGRNITTVKKDVLELDDKLNLFTKNLKLIEENITLDSYDVSELINIFKIEK